MAWSWQEIQALTVIPRLKFKEFYEKVRNNLYFLKQEYEGMELNDLTDVNTPTPSVGDTIQYDGAEYVNAPNVATDEKVKADAADPAAGFLDGKADGATLEVDAPSHKIRIKDSGVTYVKIQNVSATDKVLGRETAGAGSVEEIDCTQAGRNLIDDADAATQRTTLGLGTGDSPTFVGLTLSGVFTGPKYTVEDHTEGSGSPHAIGAADARKVLTNRGATALNYHTLPAASAGLGPFIFMVVDSDGVRVDAQAGDTIRIAGNVSPAAGNISSTTVGSCVWLVALNDTEWAAVVSVGTWNVSA